MWLWLLAALLGTGALALLGWRFSIWRSNKHVVRRSTIYSAPLNRQPKSLADPSYIREDSSLRSRYPPLSPTGIRDDTLTNVPYSPPRQLPSEDSASIGLRRDEDVPNRYNYGHSFPTQPHLDTELGQPRSSLSSQPRHGAHSHTVGFHVDAEDQESSKHRKHRTSKSHRATRTEETDAQEFGTIVHAHAHDAPVGLTTLRKRLPKREHVPDYSPEPELTSPPAVEEPVSPPAPSVPEVKFKVSLNNPMLIKISYLADSMLLALSWPNDPNWSARQERRLETLSADEPRSEYLLHNKLYVDRPDWGYRIIISVPESPGWIPDWRIRSGSKTEGHASPLVFPSPTTSPSPLSHLGSSSNPPISTVAQDGASVETPQTPKPSVFGIPTKPKISITPVNESNITSVEPRSNPFVPPPRTASPPTSTDSSATAAPPTSTTPKMFTPLPKISPTLPKWGGGLTKKEFVPTATTISPASASNHTADSASDSSTASPSSLTTPTHHNPGTTSSPFVSSDLSASERLWVLPTSKPLAPPPSPVAHIDKPQPPSTPSPPTSQSAAPSQATPSTPVATVTPKVAVPIEAWIPEPLKELPAGSRPDLFIPGPGVSKASYDAYAKVIEDYTRIKTEMATSGAEVDEVKELINDISNKIGATPDSFREKLGEHQDGFDGKLLSLQRRKMNSVYYYALDYFMIKIVTEVTLNKALESESNAIKYGERVVFMLQRHPALETFVKYHIFSRVPFAIPLLPQRRPGQSEADWKAKEMIFRPVDKDNLEEYLKRTRRLTYFYASIMNTAPPGEPNPMGIGTAWTWLARMLALPRSEISPWYLEPVVKICSRRLMYAYGAQWTKMAGVLRRYIEEPSDASSRKFFEAAPLCGSIRVNLDRPSAHTPIQGNPDLEHLLRLRANNSYKMEFEEGLYISPEQLDVADMMSYEYHMYLERHDSDIVDDLLADVAAWDAILDRVDSGQLTIKESERGRYSGNRRGGSGSRQGGGGRGRW